MNQPISPSHSRPSSPWLPIVLVILVMPFFALALLAVGVVRTFGLGPDAAALRQVALNAPGSGWHRKIEVGVGPLTTGLARMASSLVQTEPEVHAALSAFREGSVGVYQRTRPPQRSDHAITLASADRTMENRGWERVVGVRNSDELVAVYVPRNSLSPRNARVCVLVVNREAMVIASARGDLEPLLDLAREHAGPHQKLLSAVRF